MVKNKKGFMKTLEVVIAVLITFIFVIFIIPQSELGVKDKKKAILEELHSDPSFRSCALVRNTDCIIDAINDVLPATYDFKVLITSRPDEAIDDLPRKELYVDTFFFAEVDQPTIVKVYYWIK